MTDKKEIYKQVKYENFGDFYYVSNFGMVLKLAKYLVFIMLWNNRKWNAIHLSLTVELHLFRKHSLI